MADEMIDVRIRLQDAKRFIQDTNQASKAVGKIGDQHTRAARGAGVFSKRMNAATGHARRHATALKGAAGAAVGLGAAYLGISSAHTAITATEDLGKATMGLHKSFGLSIPQASRYAAVLKSRGVDAKQTTMAFTSLGAALVKAQGGAKPMIKNFKLLGLSQKDVSRDGLDFNAVIMRVSDALHDHQHSYKTAQAARTLFGRGFQTMVPLLRLGSKGLQENLKMAVKYGVTLNSKTIGPIMELVKSQRQLKLAGLGVQVQFAKAVIPTMLKLEHVAEKVLMVFNHKGWSLDRKLTETGRIVRPLVRSFERATPAITRATVKVIEGAVPIVAQHAGVLGLAVASGMIKGFINADPLGQAVIVGLLAKKLGVFALLGSMAGKKFAAGFRRTPIAAPVPTGVPVPGRRPAKGPGGLIFNGGTKGPGLVGTLGAGARAAAPIVGPQMVMAAVVQELTKNTKGARQASIGTSQKAGAGALANRLGLGATIQNRVKSNEVNQGIAAIARFTGNVNATKIALAGLRNTGSTAGHNVRTFSAAMAVSTRAIPGVSASFRGLARTANDTKTALADLQTIPGLGAIPGVGTPDPGTNPKNRNPRKNTTKGSGGGTSGQARYRTDVVEEHHHHVTSPVYVDGKMMTEVVSHHVSRKRARR